jgi:hypothetical protein
MRNHIVGKVYDVTADSINALIAQLEASTAENARLRKALVCAANRLAWCADKFSYVHDAREALKEGAKS